MKTIRKLVNKYMPDELYIKRAFKKCIGYELNLLNPVTFNEKLNWLKVHDRKDKYTMLADKFEVKKYINEIIGEEYVVKNYGVWDSFEDIDFDSLPNEFVLKCTHDSSGVIICKGKKQFDYSAAKERISISLNNNFYYQSREWPYKNIRPRVIADKLLDDHSGKELNDYKFWCFNGVPRYMYCTVKAKDIYENFYDMSFTPVDINHGFKRRIPEFEKPEAFELMKTLAAKLSAGIPFVRVDFFYVDGKVYFGEFTFYDWGGLKPFPDYKQDVRLGDLIDINGVK